jgi:hypothetical protein
MMTSIVDFATAVILSLIVAYICYRCIKTLYTVAVPEVGTMLRRDHSAPVTCMFRLPPRDAHGQLAQQGTFALGLQAIGRHMGIELAYDAHEFEETGLISFSLRLTRHAQSCSGVFDACAPTFHNDELACE